MNEDYKYLNQTALGKLFGVTSHVIGRWLIEIGLREGKNPSWRAHQEGYVHKTDNGRGTGNYHVWHREKTIQALEAAGHKRVGVEYVADLIGPYQRKACGTNRFEIVSSDNSVLVEVMGDRNAEKLVLLMNVAHTHGRL